MDLFIETLTGNIFELKVSPFETIHSVKQKIQSLEGIAANHQHLIWQNTELTDDKCLNESNILPGSKLRLVVDIRGGPINTRRIPLTSTSLADLLTPSFFDSLRSRSVTPQSHHSSESSSGSSTDGQSPLPVPHNGVAHGQHHLLPDNNNTGDCYGSIPGTGVPVPQSFGGIFDGNSPAESPIPPYTTRVPMTLLVFREGDQINFLRVIDTRGEGTLTPLAETLTSSGHFGGFIGFDDDDSDDSDSGGDSPAQVSKSPTDGDGETKANTEMSNMADYCYHHYMQQMANPFFPFGFGAVLEDSKINAVYPADQVQLTPENNSFVAENERLKQKVSDLQTKMKNAKQEKNPHITSKLKDTTMTSTTSNNKNDDNTNNDLLNQEINNNLKSLHLNNTDKFVGFPNFEPLPPLAITSPNALIEELPPRDSDSSFFDILQPHALFSARSERICPEGPGLTSASKAQNIRPNTSCGVPKPLICLQKSKSKYTDSYQRRSLPNYNYNHYSNTTIPLCPSEPILNQSSSTITPSRAYNKLIYHPQLKTVPTKTAVYSPKHSTRSRNVHNADNLSTSRSSIGTPPLAPRLPDINTKFKSSANNEFQNIPFVPRNYIKSDACPSDVLNPFPSRCKPPKSAGGNAISSPRKQNVSSIAEKSNKDSVLTKLNTSWDKCTNPMFDNCQFTPSRVHATNTSFPPGRHFSKDITRPYTTADESRQKPNVFCKQQANIKKRLVPDKVPQTSLTICSRDTNKPMRHNTNFLPPLMVPGSSTVFASKTVVSQNTALVGSVNEIKPILVNSKSKTERCTQCKKRLGLVNSYHCRCGQAFCSRHRYAEMHQCTYDYKTEGRRLLEESNPIVAARKLPKI